MNECTVKKHKTQSTILENIACIVKISITFSSQCKSIITPDQFTAPDNPVILGKFFKNSTLNFSFASKTAFEMLFHVRHCTYTAF